ncbi:MAG TPA: AtpZ/AtpI family protein [Candidatus Saccharimonadia bacterium]|nr:AtpZ/AtpI family protein [Candidatus Saccharimonadia bacterium]
MTSKAENKQERGVPANEASTLALLLAMADTTWRMFTPPALLVAGGIWFDLHQGTKPWVTIVAAAVGLSLSVLLVRSQLRKTA